MRQQPHQSSRFSQKLSETSRDHKRTEDEPMRSSGWWPSSRPAESRVRDTSADRRSSFSGVNAPSPNQTSRSNHPFKQFVVPPVSRNDIEDSKRLRVEKEELSAKCNVLMGKLRELAPETDDSIYQLVQQTDARIQHLQQNMRMKRERILGHYKMKILNLLERYGYKAAQLNLQNIHTEIDLVELLLGKFTDKDLEMQSMLLEKQDEVEQSKLEKLRLQDELSKATRELSRSKADQQQLRQELQEAHSELTSMAKSLNSRRIEETMRGQRQRISFDRQRFSDDVHRTKLSLREMEQHYHEQLQLLERTNSEMEVKITTLTKQLMDQRLKHSDVCLKLEQMKIEIEQERQHTKIEKDNTDKMYREAIRWRERFQQLERKGSYGERAPPIDYRSNRDQQQPTSSKTITRTEASGLHDRRVLAPDDRALGMFLDKEIKKLESDLHKKGLLSMPVKLNNSRVHDQQP